MGIDGGGSNLRVVVVNDQLEPLARVDHGPANPNVVGRDQAAERIQETMREALKQAGEPVVSVGIGIAGAARHYAEEWLCDVVHGALPDVMVAAASDNEIALVGANGEREGVLLLAGTGSGAFGINESGKSLQVGGWGYLLGDEGSGYWLGLQALRTTVHAGDGQLQHPGSLPRRVLAELSLEQASGIIQWLYTKQPAPVADVARLSRLVLEEAAAGDAVAQQIVEEAAAALVNQARTVVRDLQLAEPRFAFAGGLLESDNPLSNLVVRKLGLEARPHAKYPPVIGAALLAKLIYEAQQ